LFEDSKIRGIFFIFCTAYIKHIGFELNELRDLRNFADYSASKIISKSLAIDTCDRVQSIFDIISEAQEKS
jgi:hypothetical protein